MTVHNNVEAEKKKREKSCDGKISLSVFGVFIFCDVLSGVEEIKIQLYRVNFFAE